MSNVNTRGVDAAARMAHRSACPCHMDGHWSRWRPEAYELIAAYLDAIEEDNE